MDKLVMSKGFTLLEMLFVLFVISALSLCTIRFSKPIFNEKMIINEISIFIENARMKAMCESKDVEIIFDHHQITADNDLYSNPNIQFMDTKSFTYNCYGHIKMGGHVMVRFKDNFIKLVFNIGQGAFRYEKQ